MSFFDKVKTGASNLKNKVVDGYHNIKDKSDANNIYEEQTTEFKIFNNNLNTSFYGNIDYETLELTYLSTTKLNEGDVVKDVKNNKMIKITSITKEGKTFEHGISSVEPFKLDVCTFTII